jgi:hypothetical protein
LLLFPSLSLSGTLAHKIKGSGYGYAVRRTWPYIWFYCSKWVTTFGNISSGNHGLKAAVLTAFSQPNVLTRAVLPPTSFMRCAYSHIVCRVLTENSPLILPALCWFVARLTLRSCIFRRQFCRNVGLFSLDYTT